MLSEVDQARLSVSRVIDPIKKAQLGQYFTPASIAQFMAGLFAINEKENCRLLDAGAGIGSLSAAFLDRWISSGFNFKKVNLDAYEIDESLIPYLKMTLEKFKKLPGFSVTVKNDDFIHAAADWLSGNVFAAPLPKYSHAILNPPYKKIRSDSPHRAELRWAGIETVNLYSAFVALSLLLLEQNGQLVAIIPRSFCNGPYYRPFRELLLQQAAIRHLHLFQSRKKAFKDDDVLQENIIIRLERGGKQDSVIISTSTDDSFDDLTTIEYPFHKIVNPENPDRFISIPTSEEMSTLEVGTTFRYSLDDLQIMVSTGPVVDFRVKDHLCENPEPGTVPLIYPAHISHNKVEWPKLGMKKPNAIKRNQETDKWLFPNGYYCVVRRFSSKEEKRRIMANVVIPTEFGDAEYLGFENHLNVFHDNKHGLPKNICYGLALYLNTTMVDQYFRLFNGHTQVNAADLKKLPYPSYQKLIELGDWAIEQLEFNQEIVDKKVEALVDE